jgi:acyl carrier protein phosphodiesterase
VEESDPITKKLIIASTRANIYLNAGYIKTLEATYDKEMQKAYIDGQFIKLRNGLVYYAYSEKNILPSNFRINQNVNTINLAFDFNVTPMTCLVIIEQDGYSIVFDEYYQNNSNTREAAMWFRDKYLTAIDKQSLTLNIYGDPSGNALSTKSYNSDYVIIEEELKPYVKNYEMQVMRAHPAIRDRVTSVNNLFEKGRVLINPSCVRLINDLNKVKYKNEELDKSNSELTHLSDALGYYLYVKYPALYKRQSTVYGGKSVEYI